VVCYSSRIIKANDKENEMPAAGRTNASQLTEGTRIIVKIQRNDAGLMTGWNISRTKTGEDVMVARVTGKTKAANRRGYYVQTSVGMSEVYMEPIQTMWLAPEDPAGIKRAHAEALALNETMDAYPVDEDGPSAEERMVESLAETATPAAEAVKLTTEERAAARDAKRADEVAALREEFTSRPWDAGRRLAIRLRLAQLSATVYPDRFETEAEYEVDRLRARYMSTNIPEERERIVARLAALGAVVHPEGSPEYLAYRDALAKALADPRAWNFLDA
jgi:hypothetical protein